MNRRLLRWWPLALLFFALRSAGQDALRKRVSLPSTVIAAGELRKEISRQTGLQFSFGSNTIRPGQLIRLPQKSYTAKALLDEMQQQLKADYKIYEDHIIFTKRNNAASEPRNGNTSAEASTDRQLKSPNIAAQNGKKGSVDRKSDTSTDNGDKLKGKKSAQDGKINSQNTTAQNGKKGAADRKSDPASTSTDNGDKLKGKKSAQDGKSNPQNTTAQNGKKGTADRKSDPANTSTDNADKLKGKNSAQDRKFNPQNTTAQNGKKGAADKRTNALSDSINSKTVATASPNKSAPPQLNGTVKPGKPASKENPASPASKQTIGGTTSNQLSLPLQFPTAHADERLRQRAYRLAPERRPAPQTVSGSAPAIRERKSPFDINNGIFSRYTATGIEATEYFPANGSFKAGVSILHGIIGYSSNGTYGSLRYGAGSRWSFSDRWHVQASFTTGIVVKKLESDSGIIIQKSIDVRERLHRIGLQAERTLGKRWGLVGGLSWNMLNRTNTDNGARLSPGDRIFDDPVPEEGYRAIKPFYTLSSKFSEGNKTWKDRWIGIHVGLYFRL